MGAGIDSHASEPAIGGCMPIPVSIAIFVALLMLSVVSSFVLAADLDRIGAQLHLSESIFGIITALGADSPEISAALTALIGGKHDLGYGVVIGSNIFNLAALLALSAVIAGQVRIGHPGLIFNGAVAFLTTVIAAMLLLLHLSPAVGLLLFGLVFIPYVALSSLRPGQIGRLGMPVPVQSFLTDAVAHRHENAHLERIPARAALADALSVVPALVSIILASIGMVRIASSLGPRWGITDAVVGMLVLATLTGIPNAIVAIRLATQGRGAAVVSEALNSNTINILAGIGLPSVVLGAGAISDRTHFAIWWLIGMTALTVAVIAFRRGIYRWGGATIIALYIIFAVLISR